MKARSALPLVRVFAWILCLVFLIVGAFLAWDFIDDLVKDALEARFESPPTEGFGYWYRRELMKGWWAILLLIGPFAFGIVVLLRCALRWLQRRA